MEKDFNNNATLPSEVNVWTKIRNFLCQEVKITLTPKQEKVFKEVHDFWNQEITGEKVKNFLFKEIEIIDDLEL